MCLETIFQQKYTQKKKKRKKSQIRCEEIKFHLLCGFMVAWTGHVGHISCYGLDLPHELITNPGIVLEQHHSAITHDAS